MFDRTCDVSVSDGYLGSILCGREEGHDGLHYDPNLEIYWGWPAPLAASKQEGPDDV